MQSSHIIFFTNNTIWRWMYWNGSIQRSYIRKYELALKSAKTLICDLHAHYPWSIILLGVKCTNMVAFNALTSGHMNSYWNQLKTHAWSSCTISLTNNAVGCWMYENGSIQRSNIRTHELVIKSAIKLSFVIFRYIIPYQ